MIGTLNEGSLHAQLKQWYAVEGDQLERPVDGYVIDLVRGDLLVEIQTGGFSPLRKKLTNLLGSHSVRLVAPIALHKRIVRLSDDGEILSARRSPKHGRFEDVFARLVSIPTLINNELFELEVVLTIEDEYRTHQPGKAWRRGGWAVAGRSLERVEETKLFASARDLATLLPTDLPEPFTTTDLTASLGCSLRLAQQVVYCLRQLEALEVSGKAGNSIEYRRLLG